MPFNGKFVNAFFRHILRQINGAILNSYLVTCPKWKLYKEPRESQARIANNTLIYFQDC